MTGSKEAVASTSGHISDEPAAMRVLLAIDGSEPATAAVDLVVGIAWPPSSTINIVQAIQHDGTFGGAWTPTVDTLRLRAELRHLGERTVDEARTRLARSGLTVESAVIEGRPASVIVDRAQQVAADVIVVGSRGHGTIASMILGSVSAEVIDHAPDAVLVGRSPGIERIVLAWDGSDCAARAADLILHWPIFANSTVRVVSVAHIEPPWWTGLRGTSSSDPASTYLDVVHPSISHHDRLVRKMTHRIEAAGLAARADLREGDPATEILAAARAWKADLIVVGTRGRTGLPRLLLGSVARNVLHHAPCSVLVAHKPDSPDDADGDLGIQGP